MNFQERIARKSNCLFLKEESIRQNNKTLPMAAYYIENLTQAN